MCTNADFWMRRLGGRWAAPRPQHTLCQRRRGHKMKPPSWAGGDRKGLHKVKSASKSPSRINTHTGLEETVPIAPCRNWHVNLGTSPTSKGTSYPGTRLPKLNTYQTSSFPAEKNNTTEEEGREELSLETNSFMLSAGRRSRLVGEGHRRHRVVFELASSVPLLPNSRAGESNKKPFSPPSPGLRPR